MDGAMDGYKKAFLSSRPAWARINSLPQNKHKELQLEMLVYAYNLNTWKVETELGI